MADFKDILKTVAPALATALGGPLAGMAVKAIGDAIGISEPTQEKIASALSGATPDDMLKLKQANNQFLIDMRKLDIDMEQIAAEDRDSARRLNIETHAYTPAVLSWIIVVATLAMEAYLLLKGVPPGVSELIVGRVLGTLDMAFGVVLAYWLGTSASSKNKDDTIKALSK